MTKRTDIEAILERQARSWAIRSRLAEGGGEAAREALVHLAEGPWLSISRQLGSGATEVAERLSQELGWQVFDRQILSTIAEQTHTLESVLAGLDEHALAPLEEYLAHLVVPGQPSQRTVLQATMRVVWVLAKRGRAIILGRGANCFLDARYGLRVRLVAPVAQRVARVADRRGLTIAEAERTVQTHDEVQESFVRHAFGRAIDDPLGYDAVLRTDGLGPEAAAQAVLAALRGKLARGC
jgi:cytidylate kinase